MLEGAFESRNKDSPKTALTNIFNLDKVSLTDDWKMKLTEQQSTTLIKGFPSARPGSQVEELVYREMAKLGINKENTVFA